MLKRRCSAALSRPKGGPMLAKRRNLYFHFHPMHNLYSLLTALILLGMIMLFLAMPAR